MPKKYEDTPTDGGKGTPEPVPAPTGDGNPPTVIEAECGSINNVNASIDPPSNANVSVRNVGDCTVKVQLRNNSVEQASTLVKPGKQETVSGSSIDRVVIECQSSTAQHPKCRFTYNIDWS